MLQSFAMMAYGFFIFTQATIPYQDFQRVIAWRQPTNSVVGALPRTQFVGKDSETITISGVLMPSLTGGRISISMLELMAEQGEPWPLIDGATFAILGWFVIEEISETRSILFGDGSARRIEFSMKLKRTDDSLLRDVGDMIKGFI